MYVNIQLSKALVFVIWIENSKMKAFWRAFKFSSPFPGAYEITVCIFIYSTNIY